MKNASKKIVAVKNRGTVVEIGPKSYVLPPISLGMIERRGDLVGRMIDGTMPTKDLGLIADLIVEALHRNYERLDRREIADNIDVASMSTLMSALMSADPAKLVRELDADNAAAPA